MRFPGTTITHALRRDGGPWLLEVADPPGEQDVSSIGWTFPRRIAALTFARCLRAQNPGARLDLTLKKRH